MLKFAYTWCCSALLQQLWFRRVIGLGNTTVQQTIPPARSHGKHPPPLVQAHQKSEKRRSGGLMCLDRPMLARSTKRMYVVTHPNRFESLARLKGLYCPTCGPVVCVRVQHKTRRTLENHVSEPKRRWTVTLLNTKIIGADTKGITKERSFRF